MKHKSRAAIRNLALAVVGVAFLQWSFDGVRRLAKINPFESFRNVATDLEPQFTVRLEDTDFRHYHGAVLDARATVDRIDVLHDERTADLHGIKAGRLVREGRTYLFDAAEANYVSSNAMLNVRRDAHFVGPDFDLRTAQLVFEGTGEVLDIKTPVSGKFRKGDLIASKFRYVVPTGYFKASHVDYTGPIDLESELGQGNGVKRTSWNFKCDDVEQSRTDKDVLIYSKGQASDGEIIISAPHFELNKKTDVVTATGGVKYFSGKTNVLADKATIYRKEKRAILESHVQMLVKPKKDEDQPPKVEEIPPFTPSVPDAIQVGRPVPPDRKVEEQKKRDEEIRSGKSVRDYPMVVVCDRIEYFYEKGKRHANITGSPQARQELPDNAWRYAWAHSAKYDGEAETMLLLNSGGEKKDVRLKNSIGDDLVAIQILLSTKEDDDYFKASKPEGVSYIIDDEDLRDKKKPPVDTKKPPPDFNGKIGG